MKKLNKLFEKYGVTNRTDLMSSIENSSWSTSCKVKEFRELKNSSTSMSRILSYVNEKLKVYNAYDRHERALRSKMYENFNKRNNTNIHFANKDHFKKVADEYREKSKVIESGYKEVSEIGKAINIFKDKRDLGVYTDTYKGVNEPRYKYYIDLELSNKIQKINDNSSENSKPDITNRVTLGIGDNELKELNRLGKQSQVDAMNYINNLLTQKFTGGKKKYKSFNSGVPIQIKSFNGVYTDEGGL
jgi:hypothetical protein